MTILSTTKPQNIHAWQTSCSCRTLKANIPPLLWYWEWKTCSGSSTKARQHGQQRPLHMGISITARLFTPSRHVQWHVPWLSCWNWLLSIDASTAWLMPTLTKSSVRLRLAPIQTTISRGVYITWVGRGLRCHRQSSGGHVVTPGPLMFQQTIAVPTGGPDPGRDTMPGSKRFLGVIS